MKDICCIGHITLDKNVTPKQTVYMPGGTSFYFSHAIKNLKNSSNYKLVTSLAKTEYKSVEDLRAEGIDVQVFPSKKTLFFENIYGENPNERKQKVLAKADPFNVDNLKEEDAKFFHLGTLTSEDFSLDVIKMLSKKGILSVDAQGYLREIKDEKVIAVDWVNKIEALKYIDILKVNEYEAEIITGYSDYKKAAKQLADWGVKEVLLTLGSLGSIIYADNVYYKIPAYPPKEVVDATGCGDTYMTGYLYMRNQGASFQEAGCFAAAISTAKLQNHGPFSGTEDEVWDIMNKSELKPEII